MYNLQGIHVTMVTDSLNLRNQILTASYKYTLLAIYTYIRLVRSIINTKKLNATIYVKIMW